MPSPFDPREFLALARQLGAEDPEEPKLRTAVGRAYYALFLIAREKTHLSERHNPHHEIILRLSKLQGVRRAANQLDEMRRLREVADYEMLPRRPADRNWAANWSAVAAIVERVLPELEKL